MRKHPSGRPIRRREYKTLSIPRPPPDEPLTPGLRRPDGRDGAIRLMQQVHVDNNP